MDLFFQFNDKVVDFARVCTSLVKPTAKTVVNLGSKFLKHEARISRCEEALCDDDDDDD